MKWVLHFSHKPPPPVYVEPDVVTIHRMERERVDAELARRRAWLESPDDLPTALRGAFTRDGRKQ